MKIIKYFYNFFNCSISFYDIYIGVMNLIFSLGTNSIMDDIIISTVFIAI